MNKQAFAFLTLFTLILMLSIYYVTLPADQGQLNPDQLLTGQNEDQDSLATMQQQLQDKHNAQAQNSQAIVASPSASTEEKQDALQQAGQVEQNRKTEETIRLSKTLSINLQNMESASFALSSFRTGYTIASSFICALATSSTVTKVVFPPPSPGLSLRSI